jgi:hypothetical protein
MGKLRVDLAQRDEPHPVLGPLHIDDRPVVFPQDLGHGQVGIRRRATELLAVGG